MIVSELTPFSLADLGLSEEEISALGIGENEGDTGEVTLGLTEEDMAGLDGGDLNWSETERNEPAPSAPSPADEPIMVTSGDLVLDRLIALGRQQGYIDIADIIANVEDPEAEAERIEEIGMRLHEAQIEIRDGDEIIDMDAEYEEEDYAQPEMSAPSEPRASYPRDLDLVSDDFDVPVGGAAPQPEPPASDEPDMTPFSLADLGLSDEEIAALGLGGAQPAATEPVAEETPASDEPNLAPFSLSELGLSDEEISSLGPSGTQPALSEPAPAETPASDEPDLTPFSLSELGLSNNEISSFGLDDTVPEAPVAPVEETPVMPTPPAPEPVAPPVPIAQAPAVAASAPSLAPASGQPTGNDVLDAFLRQLDADPQNDVLRISVARVIGQLGMAELALKQYRYLIKNSSMLDQIVGELQDMIAYSDDNALLTGLHRALGDAYTKQGRLREAVDAYSWTLGGPRGAR